MSGRRTFGTIEKRSQRHRIYVRFSWRGERYRRQAGPTKEIAREKLSTAHALLSRGHSIEVVLAEVFGDAPNGGQTFREAVDAYLAYAEGRKRPSTLAVDRGRLRRICSRPWTAKGLPDIRTETLMKWANQRAAEGVSGPTVNRELAIVSALYKWAISMGHVDRNPVKGVPRFNEAGREREVYLSPEECRYLLGTVEPSFRPILATALYTGMRRGEILALTWRAVDFQRREIILLPQTTKTGRSRVIPMSRSLLGELQLLRTSRKIARADGTDPVFTLPNGSPVTKGVLRGMMERCQKRSVGIVAEEKRPHLNFYCFRHTAASLMVQAGVSIFEVAKILGHSTTAVTMRYAHFAPQASLAAVDRLDQVIGTPGGVEAKWRPSDEVDPDQDPGPLGLQFAKTQVDEAIPDRYNTLSGKHVGG